MRCRFAAPSAAPRASTCAPYQLLPATAEQNSGARFHTTLAYDSSVGVLGDPSIIARTYGMDYAQVCARLGFQVNRAKVGSVVGNSRVRVAPIAWLYA